MSEPQLFADGNKLNPSKKEIDLCIAELEALQCYEMAEDPQHFVVRCNVKDRGQCDCPIPTCGNKGRLHQYTDVVVEDIPYDTGSMHLLIKLPRYVCSVCVQSSFEHPLPSIRRDFAMTKRRFNQIRLTFFGLPILFVAEQFGLSLTKARNLYDVAMNELGVARGDVVAPQVLGIYKVLMGKKTCTVFLDVQSLTVLEIIQGCGASAVAKTIRTFTGHERNIQYIVTEMIDDYRSAARKVAPLAKIVCDPKTVAKQLYTFSTRAKHQIFEAIAKKCETMPCNANNPILSVIHSIRKDHYAFSASKTGSEQSDKRKDRFHKLEQEFPEFRLVHQIEQIFTNMLENCSRSNTAENIYKEWRPCIPPKERRMWATWEQDNDVQAQYFVELAKFAEQLDQWKGEFFGAFDIECIKTNDISCEVNRQLFSATLRNGDSDFSRVRQRMIYHHLIVSRPINKITKTKVTEYADDDFCTTQYMPSNIGSDPSGRRIIGTKTIFTVEEISAEDYLNDLISRYYPKAPTDVY